MIEVSNQYKTKLLEYFQKDTYCTNDKLLDSEFGFTHIPQRAKDFLLDLSFEHNNKVSKSTFVSSYENNKQIIEDFFISLNSIYGIGSRDIFISTSANESLSGITDPLKLEVKYIKKFILKKYSNMYTNFRKTHGKKVIEETGNNICPYCYRSYINIIESSESDDTEKAITPDLDHFFPKSRYPFLAVTLSNLVPSCLSCNQRAKNDEDFYKNSVYPPYKLFDKIEFDYDVYLNKIYIKNYKELMLNANYKVHLETFLIQETYATHTEILKNIVNKYRKYKNSKIDDLVEHTIGLSAFDIRKIVFYEYEFMNKKGNYYISLKKIYINN